MRRLGAWQRSVVAVTAIGFGVACGGGAPASAPLPVDELEISVLVSKAEFVRGDSAVILVTLRNPSSETVRMTFTNTCTIVYGIRSAGGPIVVPSGGEWLCAPAVIRIDLDPLEAEQRRFVWKGLSAPAGDYLVFGALGHDMAFASTPVAVRLVEAAAAP